MSQRLGRDIRASGLLEALLPPAMLRQQQAVSRVVDPTGALRREAVRPYVAPETFSFAFDGAPAAGTVSRRRRVERAGTLIRLAAYAETAPTTSCVLHLIDAAANVLATVTVPSGQQAGISDGLSVPLLGGAWLAVIVDAMGGAGGAADLSIEATERMD